MTAISELFPEPIQFLPEDARKKALEIMNALLDEGYDTTKAAPIAATTAKKWWDNPTIEDDEKRGTLHIVPHPLGWAIRRTNADRSHRVLFSRNAAYDAAAKIAQKSDAMIMVHME